MYVPNTESCIPQFLYYQEILPCSLTWLTRNRYR